MPNPENDEIMWFSPDPRAIIPLDGFHCSRSLKRRINKKNYTIRINQDFEGVMAGCASREETWINQEFKRAYMELHQLGLAHSLEITRDNRLIGGVYGVAIGGAFFAESKFHRETDASKIALYHLVEHLNAKGFILLEVQFLIPHLKTLGAVEIPAMEYDHILKQATAMKIRFPP